MNKLAFVAVLATACMQADHSALREAVDQSTYSLAETVGLAEDSVQHSAGINARIDPHDTPRFVVGTVAESTRHEIQLDLRGAILATAAAGPAGAGCQTSISLAEALAIAEAEVNGNAVQVVPDDDDPCMREIQVLVGTTLWEVKVGPAGAVVEKELSDEEL